MSNSLLNLSDIPNFYNLNAQDIKPAMQDAMNQAREKFKQIKEINNATWENTVDALTDLTERVGRIWGVISHIHSVADSKEWREEYNNLIPEVTAFFTEISQDTVLFDKFKQIRNSTQYEQLTAAQQRKLDNDLRDFVLSGATLPSEQRERFAQLQQQASTLSASFSQNVLDATDAFTLHFTDKEELQGLPENALMMFQAAAKQAGKDGFLVGLQAPHYLAIMQFANNRQLREKVYRAYIMRASELDDSSRDNSQNIDQILNIANEEAQLLGYPTYANLSLVTKMADNPEQVIEFLQDMAKKARKFAQKDLQELQEFAKQYGIDDLKAWDIAYFSEKLREKNYSFSEEEVRNYFPISVVLNGLFKLIYELYGIEFIEEKRPTWHSDVRYFSLIRNQEKIGGIYMDLYARQGKKSGAWMNDYCGRRKHLSGSVQLPQAYLVCNFAPPIENEAWLSHQEILTLFHECGHCLHHLLTNIDELGVSGINGVEWDAVELPSQFMENFAWEYDVLSAMSCHKENKNTLPEELFNKMYRAKNFQTGLFIVRQMEFALFDLLIYRETNQPCPWSEILNKVRNEVAVIPAIPENRFAHSFSHIFAGGYAAGYYSYIWAEVLSADVYAAFEEEKNRNKTGQRFLKEILSVGGSRPMAESFMAFRGRNPKPDALLRHLGLA
ncbi:MAG: M3 family metallopeptidase [Neisseriaceae bacterium]|nr:M3 family metallopeptidase [Neisseriaceae bacterium]